MSVGNEPSARDGARLSVVVAAWNGPAPLHACLAALRAQTIAVPEIIVARNFPLAPDDDLARAAAGLTDLPFPSATTVPLLRAAGLARARGDVVAFIEDHALCEPGWAASLLEGHAGPYVAVGGPVDQRRGARLVDWAAYFADYGRFMPPCREGPVSDLSGVNVSYKRSFLESASALLRDGVYEALLHEQLRAGGGTLYLTPGATVTHSKRYGVAATARQMLHLGRAFGAGRRTRWSRARRLAQAAAMPLVPIVLGARVGRVVFRAGRARVAFVAALPWMTVFLSAWGIGEAVGYVAGAGDSAAKWL